MHASAEATTVTAASQDHSKHGHGGASHHPVETADTVHGSSADAAHTCSICAACCNSVAIVGLEQAISLAPAPQSEWAEVFVHIQARPTPVPDKPPRA
ncbi:MAG: hypothetical protein V4858_11320 [Pseudomonadota bacterium]